jgi:REP element-mobilizing transposase RayT
MPRPLRIEYEGAIYHVMSRGDRREPIFRDDADRKCFLETLGEACAKTDWQVHALCLRSNHFHGMPRGRSSLCHDSLKMSPCGLNENVPF